MLDLFALALKLKAEGADQVKAILQDLRKEMTGLGEDAKKTGEKTDKGIKGMAGALKEAMKAVAGIEFFKKLIQDTGEAQASVANLEQVMRSTGNTMGFTSEELQNMASSLQDVAAVTDDDVMRAQTRMTMFSNLTKDTFSRAIKLSADLSTRTGQDIESSARMLGRALSSPEQGLRSLSKVGVQFTDAQKEMITKMVDAGETAKAQGFILDQLDKKLGGAAETMGRTIPGQITRMKNAFGELFEVPQMVDGIGGALEGVISILKSAKEYAQAFVGGLQLIANDMAYLWVAAGAKFDLFIAGMKRRSAQFILDMNATFGGTLGNDLAERWNKEANETIRVAQKQIKMFQGVRDAEAEAIVNAKTVIASTKDIAAANEESAKALEEKQAAQQKQMASLLQLGSLNVITADQINLLRQIEKDYTAELKQGNLSLERRAQLETNLDAIRKSRLTTESKKTQWNFGGKVPGQSDFGTAAAGQHSTTFLGRERDILTKDDIKQMEAGVKQVAKKIKLPLPDELENFVQWRTQFGETIASSFVNAFAAGIEKAVSSGKIGEGFKALSATLLGGLGRAMVEFGTQSLIASTLMEKIKVGLASFLPGGAVTASIAMIAAGAALSGVAARSFGTGGSSYSSAAVNYGGALPSDQSYTRLIYGNTSATVAAGMTPKQAVNVTVIGPNDPTAQRQIQELIDKGSRR